MRGVDGLGDTLAMGKVVGVIGKVYSGRDWKGILWEKGVIGKWWA